MITRILDGTPRTWTPKGIRRDLVGVVDGKVIPLLTDHDEAFLRKHAMDSVVHLDTRYDSIAITPVGYYRHGESFKGERPL